MRLSSKRAAAIVVLCSGSLIAASCGGSDDDSSGQTSYVLEDLPEDQHERDAEQERNPLWSF